MIDSRNHIAGNLFDYFENGINIHKYGPHIWHTNNKSTHEYMSQFTNWLPYKHKVKGLLDTGDYVTLPCNLETKDKLNKLGYDIIETLFRPYSEKMWGMKLEELNPNIIKRVPIRDDNNEYYFPKDAYQGMPDLGYTEMIKKMLLSDKIEIKLNTKFTKGMDLEFDHIFNSMSIDEYFDYSEGMLPYRSIKFHKMTVPDMSLPTPTINFTDTNIYTRMTDWKLYPGNKESKLSIITLEEPCDFRDNNLERYYPIKNDNTDEIVKKYKSLIPKNMSFIGRCGMYRYLDMDEAVGLSLNISKDFLSCI